MRIETSPEDIHGMHAAQGILTARGGMTSHAAVVARGMGKCCVAGCGALRIDYAARRRCACDGRDAARRRRITLDGSTGEVLLGEVPTVTPELGGAFAELMTLGRQASARSRVRTNADTPTDATRGARSSAPRASASAAPSTCSSSRAASSPCAR